ncbi:MAG TPA: hypothetical protein VM619_10775 [Luteimonas sp.]|nr:hypothetical protein [Luteimonas sp.]
MKETMSGRPEATFRNASVDFVRNELALACAKHGANVESQQYAVTCTGKPSSGQAFLAQVLLGNACTHDPVERMQFTLVPSGMDVFVTANGWLEVNRCFGDVQRVDYNNNQFRNQIQMGLDQAVANYEAKYPAGTRDPASATTLPLVAPASAESSVTQRYEADPAKRCDACQHLKVPR